MRSGILPLLFFAALQATAQDSGFQIKDYRYRTPGYQTLAVNLNFSGSAASQTQSFGKTSNRSFNLSPAGVLYTKMVSTDKRLHDTRLYSTTFLSSTNNEQDRQDVSFKNTATGFGWTRSDRFYNSNGLFLELGNDLTMSFVAARIRDTLRKENYNNLQVQNTASVGFGKGRIERVQDAQMALFILNDLAAQGLLSAPVTTAKAYAFATLLTSINNRRLFDFRRKRIYELTQIDSFLRSSGLVMTTDIRHFTTVNDNWSLAVNPYRLSGAAWYLRIKPGATYSHGNSESKFNSGTFGAYYDNLALGLEPEAGYERYVAKNLKWQHDMGASVSYKTRKSRSQYTSYSNGAPSDNNLTINDAVWTATAFYGVGFFPNSRTRLSGNFLVLADRVHNRVSTYYELRPSIFITTTYLLGYRTSLSGNLYLSYSYDQEKLYSNLQPSEKQFQSSISIAFSHILF